MRRQPKRTLPDRTDKTVTVGTPTRNSWVEQREQATDDKGTATRQRHHRVYDAAINRSDRKDRAEVSTEKKNEGSGHLENTKKLAITEWNLYDPHFITKCGENGYVIKLKQRTHDEEIFYQNLAQHGGLISLEGVYSKSKQHQRERNIGYLLLHIGNPIVHANTWYMSLAYSDDLDIRIKNPIPIKMDRFMILYAAGLEQFDYLWCYRGRTREHDDTGSDASAHREARDHWKDGL